MITASSLARRLACPSSDVLARAENRSEWADAGRLEHADLAKLDELPDELRKHVPPGSRSEVRLSYNVATREGRIIGYGDGRAYGSPGPFDIVGTADVIADQESDDGITCIDWKGGNDVESAATNPQLLFYSLAATRAMGRSHARNVIVYTRTGRIDVADFGPLELAEFANRLEEMHTAIAIRHAQKAHGAILDTVEGSWCQWCPSKHVCPSKNALLVQIGSSGLATIGDSTMTPERLIAAYRQTMAVKQLVADAEKRLVAYVDDHGPIDLGNGSVYGRFTRKGNEELDGVIATQAIREVVGESAREFEELAIERSTTKAAIKRAALQLAPTGASKLADSVVKRIRELGGSAHKASTRPIGEYRPANDNNGNPTLPLAEVNRMLGAT